ncbi:TetR family transcriptional regulator [Microlunatus endophyticus]|uniref:TetR family transcriptional regulator n=1 Tax=Microlunatus endophyticus TaxID=1716077 RepID=A0A917S046_9ACTN|nr:TetR/AcrR family transcriptional regulator [Microlunatus endophyticus]GGL48164.1 TetR family transcriptional regulator [Microlunatus endophyticus]
MSPTSAPRTARALARQELTSAITDAARTQLAEVGPAALSVRAVARELGMASSAVYRYVASRDELLTNLIIVGYTELRHTAGDADQSVRRRTDFRGRWQAFARAVRRWALDHPHEYALIYGSPVPGYAAPRTTVEPAIQVLRVLTELLRDIQDHDAAPEPLPVPRALHTSITGMREFGEGISDDLLVRGMMAWGGLLGSISLELFGHLVGAVDDTDAYAEAVINRLAIV